MPRICTALVLASSLLVAAGPAQAAKSTAGHRQEARAAKTHVVTTKKQVKRDGAAAKLTHTYTYGRT